MKNHLHMASKMRGMTLMELLAVIAIMGLIAGIALPSYRRYMLRAQRSEAKVALLQLQTAEEKYYLQYNAYTSNITGAVTSNTPGLGLLSTTDTGKYTLSVTLNTGSQGYVATATPRSGGGQTDDTKCANFIIDDRGTRSVSGPDGSQICWK